MSSVMRGSSIKFFHSSRVSETPKKMCVSIIQDSRPRVGDVVVTVRRLTLGW